MNKTDLPEDMKMPGQGAVVRRTNDTIAAILEACLENDWQSLGRNQVRKAFLAVVSEVGTEETANKYVKRIVKHGPFHSVGPGAWRISDNDMETLREEFDE